MNIPKDNYTITEKEGNGKVHYSTNHPSPRTNWVLVCVGRNLDTSAGFFFHCCSVKWTLIKKKKGGGGCGEGNLATCTIRSMQMIL